MLGDQLADHDPANDGQATRRAALGGHLTRPVRTWLLIFAGSLALFLIRFLVPVPVGQADNRDGTRLTCGLGLGPVTHGHPRFFRFAYFEYVTRASCAGRAPYPSSELLPMELGRLLTPIFGLPGVLNLIALGVVLCVLASVGIASLATGLRIRLWAQLAVAAVAWLIMADAAFFDVYAGPFSEGAALVGLLLVAAGVVQLGRGWRATVAGLALAGSGGVLAILSKEQYLVLAAPICLTLVLASADQGSWRGLRRFRNRQAGVAVLVAGLLAILTAGYMTWNYTSHYGQRLEHIQAVDFIFTDIVTKKQDAPAELRALGLPVSWSRYAGHWYWDGGSVRTDPTLPRYYGQLTDTNLAHYLITHPGSIVSIGQSAAVQAQVFRVTALGDYPPSAGHPPGTVESREVVLTWLMHRLPHGLGFGWYIPVWAGMVAIAVLALRRRRREPWHRDGAVMVLCMTACALVAFVPPAYFAGISTTRHMVGTNLATLLALTVAVPLAGSMVRQALARPRSAPGTVAAPYATPELAGPASRNRGASSADLHAQ
jgi:hypothetical protein